MHLIIITWKESLRGLLEFYELNRPKLHLFFPFLFLFFILINVVCYWGAMVTAFPELLIGSSFIYYFKIQFPVGILGALFDSLSFFITILIIRKALESSTTMKYIGHLSIDFIIAVLATFWVVFVFSISGWLIHLLQHENVLLAERNAEYTELVVSAVKQPTENLRNIYFGLIMGISAMIPTCTHIYLSFRSVYQVIIR